METSEHIVESYVRYIKKWFTNSNISTGRKNKEVDILAMDKKGNKYWIECGVTISKNYKLKSKSKRSPHTINKKTGEKYNKWIDTNSLDYFKEVKFNDSSNRDKIEEFGFVGKNYKKIIVVWQIGEKNLKEKAKKEGYEIWELKEILPELIEKIGTSYYSDDILRILQLISELNGKND